MICMYKKVLECPEPIFHLQKILNQFLFELTDALSLIILEIPIESIYYFDNFFK